MLFSTVLSTGTADILKRSEINFNQASAGDLMLPRAVEI